MTRRLKDVFTPGGLPSVTYVSRDHLGLEKKILDALARGYAFTVVTGPTKSGKTVLCKRVLSQEKLVTVEGGQIRSEADFWTHIGHELKLPSENTEGDSATTTATVSGEGGGGIPGVFQAKGGAAHADSAQTSSALKYNNVLVRSVIKTLVATGTTLLIDDFHYIEAATQRAIIQSLKSAVFDGLSVLLLAVPHRAFDPLTVENEVEGRFKHIAIPQWSLDDLIKIPEVGFPDLNVTVKRELQRRISEDSFGNPLLVQEICSEFCLKNDLRERALVKRELDGRLLESTYSDMVASKGSLKFQRLVDGPLKGKKRQLKRMRGGGEEDIYKGLLASVVRLGPKSDTSLAEIRNSYRALLDATGPSPRKAEIVSALAQMSAAAKNSSQGEAPLEWLAAEERLILTDPFLLFYLKWSFRGQ